MILFSGIKKSGSLNDKVRKKIEVENQFSSARLIRYGNNLDLAWIETVEHKQHKGYGTEILNCIVTNYLQPNETLNIKVADESTLEFYFRWLQRMGFDKKLINGFISDAGDSGCKISIPASILNTSQKMQIKP